MGDEKKVVVSTHPNATPEPAKNVEQAVKNKEKAEKQAKKNEALTKQHESELNPDVKAPDFPTDSEVFIPTPSRPPGRNGARQMGVPVTRYLRDGTQILILPDGTRIMTKPDGTKQVLPPGAKLPRRRAAQ